MNRFRLLFFVCTVAGQAAFAQRDILPRPPRGPAEEAPLSRLVRDTRVGTPVQHKNLVVFPLYTAGAARRGYVTLDDALARRLIRISEKGQGNVPELLVENVGAEPVFLLAGEVVSGGKQNRVISQDILLAPHSGPISLGVFCVEHGRWARQTEYFSAEKELAHSNLRQQLNAPTVAQAGVWSEVARKNAAVAGKVANETGALNKMYEDRDVRRDVDDYARELRLPAEANGMAVVIGGRVVGVELFGDSATFRALREKLLRSYAVDALEYREFREPAPGRDGVERFLRRAAAARLTVRETVGVGRYFAVSGGGLYGSVLVWREQDAAQGVVHTSLFDEQPVVAEQPPPRYVPFERE